MFIYSDNNSKEFPRSFRSEIEAGRLTAQNSIGSEGYKHFAPNGAIRVIGKQIRLLARFRSQCHAHDLC